MPYTLSVRMEAMRSLAFPSPKTSERGPFGRKDAAAEQMASRSAPTSTFQPSSTVSVYSVFSRRVTHGTPRRYASFCTPPESVRMRRAFCSSASMSRYPTGSMSVIA